MNNDLPITSVRIYTSVHSPLAETLFPGSDAYSLELRHLFGEFESSLQQGDVFLDKLESYIPSSVNDSIQAWKDHNIRRWMNYLRPTIEKAYEDFFMRGGQQKRVQLQVEFLDQLESSGIHISSRTYLADSLTELGIWQEKFMYFSLCGRRDGVVFTGKRNLDFRDIQKIMVFFGFDLKSTQRFISGLSLQDSISSERFNQIRI